MADTLQIPFAIRSNGSAAVVDINSDDCVNQDIAAAVLTHYGERLLFPAFGIPDPAFDKLDPTRLAACISTFGPRVNIESVETVLQTSFTQEVRVSWNRGS